MRSTKLTTALAAAGALMAFGPAVAVAAPHAPKLSTAHKHRSAAGCRVSIAVEPRTVTTGDSVLVSGTLVCPPSGVVSGQPVSIYERIAGVPGFKLIGTPSTGTTGGYVLTPAPVVTDSTFYARVSGARSANRTAKVAPVVTVATDPAMPEGSQLFTGHAHEVTFKGAVSPPDKEAEVRLQRESSTSNEEWSTIQAHAFVKADGTFTIAHRFLVPGDANLRVVVRPHGVFDVRGTSNMLTYEISQTQNPNLTLEPTVDPVTYGQSVTLKGVAKAGAGQKVILMGRTFGMTLTKMGEATTGTGGAYEITVPNLTQSTYFRAKSATVNSATVNSATVFEGVKWVIDSSTVSLTKVTSGQEVQFSGTVSPGRGGHFVYLERQNASGLGYHVVDLGTVAPTSLTTGTYSITYPVAGSGKQTYRIRIPGDPINQSASSTPVALEVTPSIVAPIKPLVQPTLPH
jgi:hypothetical protein